MNPFYWLSDPQHARAAFWVLFGSGVLYVLGLAMLGILVRRAARWLWRQVSAVAGSWVSFLWFQWSTRPVRECRSCRRAEPEQTARTRRQVFGPLREFGPYRMPRRTPSHVPPQVLPSRWPDEDPRGDGSPWFDREIVFDDPVTLAPLSWDGFVEQVRAEYDSGQWRGDTP